MYKNNAKKDYYLYEDRFFGGFIFFYRNGGKRALTLVALFYAIPAICLMLKCYLSGQTWSDFWHMYLWALVTPHVVVLYIMGQVADIMGGGKRLVSQSVLLQVLLELNNRCSNGSAVNWRAIAHSANKFSKEQGESPMVFYSGFHCMWYFCFHAAAVMKGGRPLFKYKCSEQTTFCNDIAQSAFEKYKARIQSFCDELDSYSVPLTFCLERRKETLGIKEVRSH